jgi:hypothetical protein
MSATLTPSPATTAERATGAPAGASPTTDLASYRDDRGRERAARATADGRECVPMPAFLGPPEGWIDEVERSRYLRRLRPQPLGSFAEPVRLSGAGAHVRRAFVRCTHAAPPDDPIAAVAARARASGWAYRELAAPHDPQLVDPDGTARVLDELACSILG